MTILSKEWVEKYKSEVLAYGVLSYDKLINLIHTIANKDKQIQDLQAKVVEFEDKLEDIQDYERTRISLED